MGIATQTRNLHNDISLAPAGTDALDLIGITQGPGKRFWVSSVTGSASRSSGLSPDKPLATLAAALAKCRANMGDTVYLLPGHSEASSTTFANFSATAGDSGGSVAGTNVVGLGTGTLKPTFTIGTTTHHVNVDVANIRIRGLKFVNNIDSLETFLDVNEGNFTCEDCEFVTSSTKEALCFVDIATTKDRFTFRRCSFYQPTDPAGTDGGAATGCFYFVDSEELFFDDCFFYGAFETAIWHNKTTAAKNVWIRNCYGSQLLLGAEVMLHVAAMEGGVLGSHFNLPAHADVTDTTVWSSTMSDKFAIGITSGVLADGAAGGQLAAPGSAVNS